MDQIEGSFVPAAWNCFRDTFDSGESEFARCRIIGGDDLVFLPVLLFRILRHRKVCGLAVQIFRALVVCQIFLQVAKVAEALALIVSTC